MARRVTKAQWGARSLLSGGSSAINFPMEPILLRESAHQLLRTQMTSEAWA